jgi:hypothetical protein
LQGKYYNQVKIGIKNNLISMIAGKPTWPVTSPPPVTAPNLAAINCFLEDDCKVQDELIYPHLSQIPVANDFCNTGDSLDNETNCLNDMHNGE